MLTDIEDFNDLCRNGDPRGRLVVNIECRFEIHGRRTPSWRRDVLGAAPRIARTRRRPEPTRGIAMDALRSLYGGTVGGILSVGLRSIATVETVLEAVLFYDGFGCTEDS